MRTLCSESWRDESGSSAIESALILPVLLSFTFGIINFSLILFGMGNINFASRSALRYATLHSNTSYSPTTQADLDRIVNSLLVSYPSSTHSVSATYPNGNVVGGGVTVNVRLTYSFNIMGRTYSGISYNSSGYGSILQ